MSMYSKSPKVGNPIASILKGNVKGIPALFGLNPVSNSIGFTVVSFCRSHCCLLPQSKHRNAEHNKNHVGCVKAALVASSPSEKGTRIEITTHIQAVPTLGLEPQGNGSNASQA